MENSKRRYSLKDEVRVYYNNEDEIRFRKGIWNYTEAVINLTGQPKKIKKVFAKIVEQLAAGGEARLDFGAESTLTKNEQENVSQLLETINYQGFFALPAEKEINKIVGVIFGESIETNENIGQFIKPVLFFADNEIAKKTAQEMAKDIGLPLDVLSQADYEKILTADLTSQIDAIGTTRALTEFTALLAPYSCVVGSFVNLNISFLRNLNRCLLKLGKPAVISYIDGPFVSAFSTFAPQTGCFECLEQRIIARMQDMVTYHKFIDQMKKNRQTHKPGKIFSPSINLLTALVLGEAYLFAVYNMSRLCGRVLNIYLPVFEIQVQDLLRVPYCPACGFPAKARLKEFYTSSKNIIEQMVADFEITK